MDLEARVRERLVALYREGPFTLGQLAQHLGVESASGVSKQLAGHRGINLAHVEGYCQAFNLTPAELVAEPGAQVLPLAPLEVQLIARFRKMTPLERQSLLTVLDWQSHQPRSAKLRRAHLAGDDAILLTLYHALDHAPDAQAAFVGALREHPAALMRRATPP